VFRKENTVFTMAANQDIVGSANYINSLQAIQYTAHELEPYTRAGLKFVYDNITNTLAGLGLKTCTDQCSQKYGAYLTRYVKMH